MICESCGCEITDENCVDDDAPICINCFIELLDENEEYDDDDDEE